MRHSETPIAGARSRLQRGGGPQGSASELSAYRSWLISRGKAVSTADLYTKLLEKSAADPMKWLREVSSYHDWLRCRSAWRLWGDWRSRPDVYQAISTVRPPARRYRPAKAIPDLRTWYELGGRLWAIPGPLGAILWILCYSGLRVGDLVGMSAAQIREAAELGHTSRVMQKGGRGRRWTPGPLVRPACARLARDLGPVAYVWQVLARDPKAAAAVARGRIPAPFSPHSFRHSVISYHVSIGTPLPEIQEITGHADLSALARYIQTHVAVPPTRTDSNQGRLAALILSAIPGVSEPPKRNPGADYQRDPE